MRLTEATNVYSHIFSDSSFTSTTIIQRVRWSRGKRAGLWYPSSRVQNPAEAVGIFGRKNPQRAFLRRGSKAAGPMS